MAQVKIKRHLLYSVGSLSAIEYVVGFAQETFGLFCIQNQGRSEVC